MLGIINGCFWRCNQYPVYSHAECNRRTCIARTNPCNPNNIERVLKHKGYVLKFVFNSNYVLLIWKLFMLIHVLDPLSFQ